MCPFSNHREGIDVIELRFFLKLSMWRGEMFCFCTTFVFMARAWVPVSCDVLCVPSVTDDPLCVTRFIFILKVPIQQTSEGVKRSMSQRQNEMTIHMIICALSYRMGVIYPLISQRLKCRQTGYTHAPESKGNLCRMFFLLASTNQNDVLTNLRPCDG